MMLIHIFEIKSYHINTQLVITIEVIYNLGIDVDIVHVLLFLN
jgi:hypothetical protein